MPTYHINYCRYLEDTLENLGWTRANHTETADFGMWYEPKQKTPSANITLFNSGFANVLDNKLSLYQTLHPFGCEDVMPAVFTTFPDYLKFLSNSGSPVFCYLKLAAGVLGEGTYCFNTLKGLIDQLQNLDSSDTAIIQQGIKHPMLVEGRKTKLRAFVLLDSQWNIYLYKDPLATLHSRPYDPDSVERDIQLSPNYSLNVVAVPELDNGKHIKEQMKKIASKVFYCLKRTKNNFPITGDYLVYGFDFICDCDGRVFLIEINAYPAIERIDEVGNRASRQMMEDFYHLIIAPSLYDVPAVAGGFELIPEYSGTNYS